MDDDEFKEEIMEGAVESIAEFALAAVVFLILCGIFALI